MEGEFKQFFQQKLVALVSQNIDAGNITFCTISWVVVEIFDTNKTLKFHPGKYVCMLSYSDKGKITNLMKEMDPFAFSLN